MELEQQPSITKRQAGKTSRQMVLAVKNSLYIWPNHHLEYPRELAKRLERPDLVIKSAAWVTEKRWQGMELSGVTVDHGVRTCWQFQESLIELKTRIRK